MTDNLNVRAVSSPHEAFKPAEARRLAERFEIHTTPKHGSWLKVGPRLARGRRRALRYVAEIFLSTLSRQCLDQRVETHRQAPGCHRHLAGVADRRQGDLAKQARIKLHRLHPSIP